MIAQLSRLERLRQRDVDRAARVAAAAQVTLEQARVAVASAEMALSDAETRLARSVELRAHAPGQESARLFVTRCEAAIGEARQALESTRGDLTAAEQAMDQARRDWMRAQVRRDAITGLAREHRRDIARGRERRQADETNESLSSGGRQWA